MTKTDYEILKPFERQLRNAVVSRYVRFSRGELGKLVDVYERNYNVKMGSKVNCNTCVLNMLRVLYDDFTKFTKWYEKRWGTNTEPNLSEGNAVE